MRSVTANMLGGLMAVTMAGVSWACGDSSCSQGFEGCACAPDNVCLSGLSCTEGKCERLSDQMDPANEGNSDASHPNDPDASSPSQDACDLCNDGQVCVGGVCQAPPENCPCPLGSYCDLLADKCVVGCREHGHCPADDYCESDAQRCVEGCRDDASCGTERICNDQHACVPGCRDDENCTDGKICNDADLCVAGCRYSEDCVSYLCDTSRNVCVECFYDDDCDAGETCSAERLCMLLPPDCGTGGPCPSGTFCNAASECEVGECASVSNCTNADSCTEGMCAEACSTSTACSDPGDECVSEFFTTGNCLPACTDSTDCPLGYSCHSGNGPDLMTVNVCWRDCTNENGTASPSRCPSGFSCLVSPDSPADCVSVGDCLYTCQ